MTVNSTTFPHGSIIVSQNVGAAYTIIVEGIFVSFVVHTMLLYSLTSGEDPGL
jgi:hypothetical protein